MNDYVVIIYNGEQVSVPKEVADFLEQDRKRERAQEKQDARHLSKSEFETVLSGLECVRRPVEDGLLADDGGDRSDLWHLQNGGIKATEKATQKAGKLCLMTGLPSFFENFVCPLVYKRALSVLIDERQICSAIGAWLSWPQPYRLTRTQRSVYDHESI